MQVRFKNRATTCRAMVLPGDTEPLFGAIPLEDMDLIIHPLKQGITCKPRTSVLCTDEFEEGKRKIELKQAKRIPV
ncbi:MAG: hypothetical protein IPN10_06835 [Saprospiraceae bacterium]|nr:hypothetical protein [Saprospiraceae bacterium]